MVAAVVAVVVKVVVTVVIAAVFVSPSYLPEDDDDPPALFDLSPLVVPVVVIAVEVPPNAIDIASAATLLALGLMQMGIRHVPVTPHSR